MASLPREEIQLRPTTLLPCSRDTKSERGEQFHSSSVVDTVSARYEQACRPFRGRDFATTLPWENLSMANTSVFAVYATREQVERTVDALRTKGFRATDVSVLWPENVGSKDLAHEMHTKAPEGAT